MKICKLLDVLILFTLLPLLALSLPTAAIPSAVQSTALGGETMRLIEFAEPADVAAWRPVHDGVMGGLSQGSAELVGEAVRFAGTVSLENNGGFASFRTSQPLGDLSSFDGLRLAVRGDGQTYKLSLQTDRGWRAPSWQASFGTQEGEWISVDVRFAELVPMWRGNRVREAGAFDSASIVELGLLISDKQSGPFVLEVRSIDAWRAVRPKE